MKVCEKKRGKEGGKRKVKIMRFKNKREKRKKRNLKIYK